MRRCLLAGIALLLAHAAPLAAQIIVLNGATVIDGTGAAPQPNTTIVIAAGAIAAIYPTGTRIPPGGADIIDARGKFIIPGLIDSHVHLVTDPATTDPRDVVIKRLRQALYGGVTAVRDMAGDVRMIADLKRAAVAGEIKAPDIYYSALWAGPLFFTDPRTIAMAKGLTPGSVPWAFAVTDTVNIPLAVARANGSGATGIKIYTFVPPPLYARIAGEAHRQGLRVWSHAHVRPSAPIDVVTAGTDVISHADLLICVLHACTTPPDVTTYRKADATDPKLLQVYQRMRSNGAMLDATLFVFHTLAKKEGLPKDQRARLLAREEFGAAVTRAAHAAGVEIVAGTDSIGDGDLEKLPNIHYELELLVTKSGLTPLAAIRAATLAGARALGLAETRGSIAVGKVGDLVVLDADPSIDINNTRAIRYVVHRGRIYRKNSP